MAILPKNSNYSQKNWIPAVSYDLWRLFTPSIGCEYFHCDTKRGFIKARNKELEVKRLLSQDSSSQRIGKLAQQGVYEFHQNPSLLYIRDGVEYIVQKLELSRELAEIQTRVLTILTNYYQNPILVNKKILNLLRGDEGYPKPVLIKQGDYQFNLYPAFDCVIEEGDDTVHILDFKTGKSNFDRRQANVYLVAAELLYPNLKLIASFYNLETQESSPIISLSVEAIEAIKIELALISKKHQKQLKHYRDSPQDFYKIFAANPGSSCKFCCFTSLCNYSNIS